MATEFQIKFVDAGAMGDLLGVKAKHVRIWARQDKIPKLTLPNGRFAFNPNAVIQALKTSKGSTNGE